VRRVQLGGALEAAHGKVEGAAKMVSLTGYAKKWQNPE
jgi:hypothetical protein